MTAGAPNSGDSADVELGGSATAPPPPPPDANGGPNAPHPDDPDAAAALAAEALAADEAAAAAAEEEDGPTWDDDDTPSDPGEPPSGSESEPSETQTVPPSSGDGSEPAAPTAEVDGEGDEPERDESEDREPSEPEPESRSGAQTRPYTVLEEQEVVPMHLLTEAQKKSLAKHAATGYVVREDQVVSRNTEAVLQAIYGEDGLPEHVSRVLPLSERSYSPVALDLEPVQRSRLRIRR